MKTLKVIEKITNQDGEMIPSESIVVREDGVVCRQSLVCFSSSDLGLGTCGCHSHDPYMVRPIQHSSLGGVWWECSHCGRIETAGPFDGLSETEAWLDSQRPHWCCGSAMPDDFWGVNQTPLERFNQILSIPGLTVEDLERFCELSYRLNSNPVPKLRKLFPGFQVNFMYQDDDRKSYWSWDEGDPPTIVVELCDERDQGHGLRVWIETYGF